MRVEIPGEDKEFTGAVAQLKQHKEAAQARLKELGADAGSIRFSPAGIDSAAGGSAAQMQRMVMMRMQKKLDPKQLSPLPKIITTTLTADFPLSATDPEAILLQAHELQEKIKSADLADSDKGDTLSAEESELMEEMEGMIDDYGMPESSKPGEPAFTYVFQVSEPDGTKALADAYAKARAQAEALAGAA